MARTALLKHDLPDGSWHYDWLLEPPQAGEDPDERSLITFRVHRSPDAADLKPGDSLGAERLPEHRRIYLEFEGELAGGRGVVKRLASGTCQVLEHRENEVVFICDWGRGAAAWRAEAIDAAGAWRLVIVSAGAGR